MNYYYPYLREQGARVLDGGERGPLSPRRIATPLVSWPAMQFHCNATHFSLRDWQTHIIHRIVSTDVLHTQQHY